MRFGRSPLAAAALVLMLVLELALVLPPLVKPLLVAFKPEVAGGLAGSAPGWTLANVIDIYTQDEYRIPLVSTISVALTVTIVSALVGVALAFLVHRTALPAKGFWDAAIILPFFLSPFSAAIAWVGLGATQTGYLNLFATALGLPRPLNIFSYAGVVWVMVSAFVPVAYLTISGPLRAMDGSIEEAALMVGASPWRAVRDITLRVLAPGLLGTAVLVLVLSAELYSIPALIGLPGGVKSLPWTAISLSQNWPPQYGHAAAASLILLVITAAGMAVYTRTTRASHRFVTIGGKGGRPRVLELGAWRWPCAAMLATYVTMSTVLPYLALLVSSFQPFASQTLSFGPFTLDNYRYLLASPDIVRGFWNTLVVSVVAASLSACLVLVAAYGVIRAGTRTWAGIEWLMIVPVALPGVIIGYGILWTYVSTPLYGTLVLLVLVNVLRWQSFGIGVTKAGLIQVDRALEEAARVSGAGAVRAALTISLPLIRRSVLAAWLFMIVMSMKELAASLLVASTRNTVLAVSTWDLAIAGEFNKSAALAVVQSVLILLLIAVATRVFGIDLRGVGTSSERVA